MIHVRKMEKVSSLVAAEFILFAQFCNVYGGRFYNYAMLLLQAVLLLVACSQVEFVQSLVFCCVLLVFATLAILKCGLLDAPLVVGLIGLELVVACAGVAFKKFGLFSASSQYLTFRHYNRAAAGALVWLHRHSKGYNPASDPCLNILITILHSVVEGVVLSLVATVMPILLVYPETVLFSLRHCIAWSFLSTVILITSRFVEHFRTHRILLSLPVCMFGLWEECSDSCEKRRGKDAAQMESEQQSPAHPQHTQQQQQDRGDRLAYIRDDVVRWPIQYSKDDGSNTGFETSRPPVSARGSRDSHAVNNNESVASSGRGVKLFRLVSPSCTASDSQLNQFLATINSNWLYQGLFWLVGLEMLYPGTESRALAALYMILCGEWMALCFLAIKRLTIG